MSELETRRCAMLFLTGSTPRFVPHELRTRGGTRHSIEMQHGQLLQLFDPIGHLAVLGCRRVDDSFHGKGVEGLLEHVLCASCAQRFDRTCEEHAQKKPGATKRTWSFFGSSVTSKVAIFR